MAGGRGALRLLLSAQAPPPTSLTPDRSTQLGLSEVARIRAEMEAVKARAGLQGQPRRAFHQFLRTDPRFFYQTRRRAARCTTRALAKRIDPQLVQLFRTLPRQPYGVEPTPAAMAPDATTGFYYPGAADGSRAGTYWVNPTSPRRARAGRWSPSRCTRRSRATTCRSRSPPSRRSARLPAPPLHWPSARAGRLYCETLGDELGLVRRPVRQVRPARLRDVARGPAGRRHRHAREGLDAAQQAIEYFLENSPRTELDVTNEVDRYIAWPGQALAYKMGQLQDPRAAHPRREGARRPLRRARVPRRGAARRARCRWTCWSAASTGGLPRSRRRAEAHRPSSGMTGRFDGRRRPVQPLSPDAPAAAR